MGARLRNPLVGGLDELIGNTVDVEVWGIDQDAAPLASITGVLALAEPTVASPALEAMGSADR
jgi:hypothetical protein